MKRNEAPRREERQPRAPGAGPRPREAAGGRGVLSGARTAAERECVWVAVRGDWPRSETQTHHFTKGRARTAPRGDCATVRELAARPATPSCEGRQRCPRSSPSRNSRPSRRGHALFAGRRFHPHTRGRPCWWPDPAGGQTHPHASALTSLRPEGEDPRRSTKGCLNCGGARCGARG